MLQIKNISKTYTTGELVQTALNDVSLSFRSNEFVAILGPSGSGKTTLLNIVGGLDRYDSGDLIINGISTKQYKDRDWDSYRNHTIGFVFQSYNLIPHQTILSNVELALTISGVSKKERRRRAAQALESVGLKDHLHKRPNQLSGGQMQRVAIARALVNDPDILMADEPTGALDSETSLQVMQLLKEVAKDRLVVMVTHNSELANKFATRIVNLRDGRITADSNPFDPESPDADEPVHKNMGRTSMSFLTALTLSMNNLRTKKARTFLTSFAGSIGIIGIALILSLSNGVNSYIEKIQEDTLSSYPISISSESVDMTSLATTFMETNSADGIDHELDKIYSNTIMTDLMSTFTAQIEYNDLAEFKKYIDSGEGSIDDYVSDIQYGYDLDFQIYSSDTSDGVVQLNPSQLFSGMPGVSEGVSSSGMSSMVSWDIFDEMLGNRELLSSQYDVIAGRWPDAGAYDEVVLIVDTNNEISDMALYSIGFLDQDEYRENMKKILAGEEVESRQTSFTYEEILGTAFKLVLNSDIYSYDADAGIWADMREDAHYMTDLVNRSLDLKIVGILRPNEESVASSIASAVGYTSELTKHVINTINDSDIAKAQLADPDTDVFTGMPFDMDEYAESLTMDDVYAYIATLPPEEQEQFQMMSANMTQEQILEMFAGQMTAVADESSSYDGNLRLMGVVDSDYPSTINIYCSNFEAKDFVGAIINDYNDMQRQNGHEEYVISYTDLVGLLMSSVTSIVDIISYVLIGFVSISLVVSSIMIAVITYISVLERTKEIGILRAIGASKSNVSGIFNAETLIIGFISGAFGILITLLLNIPINAVIKLLAGVSGISVLPPQGGVMLILISMLLTLIAGIIPSRMAAKCDPVTALRTE